MTFNRDDQNTKTTTRSGDNLFLNVSLQLVNMGPALSVHAINSQIAERTLAT